MALLAHRIASFDNSYYSENKMNQAIFNLAISGFYKTSFARGAWKDHVCCDRCAKTLQKWEPYELLNPRIICSMHAPACAYYSAADAVPEVEEKADRDVRIANSDTVE